MTAATVLPIGRIDLSSPTRLASAPRLLVSLE